MEDKVQPLRPQLLNMNCRGGQAESIAIWHDPIRLPRAELEPLPFDTSYYYATYVYTYQRMEAKRQPQWPQLVNMNCRGGQAESIAIWHDAFCPLRAELKPLPFNNSYYNTSMCILIRGWRPNSGLNDLNCYISFIVDIMPNP